MEFENSDTILRQEFYFDGVNNLQFDDIFNVVLVQDTSDVIIVNATQSNIDKITFKQDSNWLFIDNRQIGDMFRGKRIIPELEIHLKSLDSLICRDYCNVTNRDTLTYWHLYLLFYGDGGGCDLKIINHHVTISASTTSGSYKLSGKSDWNTYTVTGTSELDAENMICETPLILNTSTRDLSAYSSDYAVVRIFSSGNVILPFEPDSVILTDFGAGELIYRIK